MAKILLVEDDTNLSEIYQARMEAEGYTVVAAADGESALAVAAKERPDLIISDVMMPKISGFEMLDILRNTPGLKDTPVIMLTALGQADDKSRADSLGANRYLVKSQVTLEDIVSAAQAILEDDKPKLNIPTTEPPANSGPVSPTSPAAGSSGNSTSVAAATVAAQPAPAVTPAAQAPTGPLQASTPAAVPRPAMVTPAPAQRPQAASIAPATRPALKAGKVTRQPTPVVRTTPGVPAAEPQPGPRPAPEPVADAAAIDDKIVTSTIDKLLQKKPQSDADISTYVRPSSNADSSFKKVIAPPDTSDKLSLQELVAKEEAENPSSSVEIADTYIDSSTPPIPANRDGKSIDPNSIAI